MPSPICQYGGVSSDLYLCQCSNDGIAHMMAEKSFCSSHHLHGQRCPHCAKLLPALFPLLSLNWRQEDKAASPARPAGPFHCLLWTGPLRQTSWVSSRDPTSRTHFLSLLATHTELRGIATQPAPCFSLEKGIPFLVKIAKGYRKHAFKSDSSQMVLS